MSDILTPNLGVPIVYLVDDEEVVRDALTWLLRSRRLLSDGYPSAEAFEDAVDGFAAANHGDWPRAPSCVVLDQRMGGMNGLTLFDRLADRGLTAVMPVIFLTGHGDVPTAVAAVRRGAFDFVEKPFSNNSLVDLIEKALAESAVALLRTRERATRLAELNQLSDREHEVMRLVGEGLSNKQVAERLNVSVRTAEVHRAHVFEKLNVASAVQLANLLNRHDI